MFTILLRKKFCRDNEYNFLYWVSHLFMRVVVHLQTPTYSESYLFSHKIILHRNSNNCDVSAAYIEKCQEVSFNLMFKMCTALYIRYVRYYRVFERVTCITESDCLNDKFESKVWIRNS